MVLQSLLTDFMVTNLGYQLALCFVLIFSTNVNKEWFLNRYFFILPVLFGVMEGQEFAGFFL